MYTDRFRYKFMYLSQSTQIKMIFSHKIYIEWCSSKPLLFVYKNRGLYKFYKFDIYFMSKKKCYSIRPRSFSETILPSLLLFRHRVNSKNYISRIRPKLSQSTQIKMIFSHKIYIEWCSSKPLLFVL